VDRVSEKKVYEGFSIIQPARISGYDDGRAKKEPKKWLEEIE